MIMTKYLLKDSTLLDITNAIRTKKGTTGSSDTISVKNIASEILSITGGGDCTNAHVIEVTELPTENINKNAVYLCDGSYYKYANVFTDVVIFDGGDAIKYVEVLSQVGYTATANTIPTKTTDDIMSSNLNNGILHFYYIEDDKNVFLYTDDTWATFGELVSDSETIVSYGGTISDVSEATTANSYYALFNDNWTKYSNITIAGTLAITENGTYDVASCANVEVDIPNSTVMGIWKWRGEYWDSYYSYSIPNSINQKVNFTAIVEGETANFVEIQCVAYENQIFYVRDDGVRFLVCDLSRWSYAYQDAYIINFGSTPQLVSNAFMENLSNAIPIYKTEITEIETITFTINSVKYFAESGATWQSWVESKFNEDGYTIGNDNTVQNVDGATVMLSSTNVTATDSITNGTAYTRSGS